MTRIVSPQARIGANCRIGDFVKIYDGVILGDDCVVEDHCILGLPCDGAAGDPLVIGDGAVIRSHCVFNQGSVFGSRLETGSMATVRERTQAGDGLRIGTKSDLQGYNSFGDYVMIHSFVQVAQHARVGDFVWLYPRVSFTDDPMPPSFLKQGVVVEEMAVIAVKALLMPGVTVGAGAFVSADSLVKNDVPPVTVVAGNPARVVCPLRDLNRLPYDAGYPWHDHFAERYPPEARGKLHEVGERVRRLMNLEGRDEIRLSCAGV